MLRNRLLASPRVLSWALRVDRAPAGLWLGLLALSLAPTWWWLARRLVDGSDDPLGVAAWATLAALAWSCRRSLRWAPRLGWLTLALAGALLSTAAQGVLPPLLAALAGLLALGAGLVAFLPSRIATTPVLGLSVLSLPLLASLQFYAGYPLRVLTAQASGWLLAPWFAVERSGTALRVDGHLVIVDAPCSGVQMLWLGYYTACVTALLAARGDRALLARLPAVSALVLAGNVVRNAVLVACEAGGRPLPPWGHDAVGLLVLAAVCAAIGWIVQRPEGGRRA